MKKVLSTLLAGAMVASMGAAAFADTLVTGNQDLEKIKGYADGHTLYEGIINNGYTVDVSTNRRATVKMGTVYAQDEPEFKIDLLTSIFGATDTKNATGTTYYVVDVEKMKKNGLISNTNSYTTLEDIELYGTSKLASGYQLSTYKTAAETAYNTYVGNLTPVANFTALGTSDEIDALAKANVSLLNTAIDEANRKAIADAEAQATAMFNFYQKAGYVKAATSGVHFYDYVGVPKSGKLDGAAATTPTLGSSTTKAATRFAGIVNAGQDVFAATATGSTVSYTYEPGVAGVGAYFYKEAGSNATVRNLTSEEIQRSRISLVTQMKGDSSPFKSADIDRTKGQIIVELKDEWVPVASNKFAVDFEMLMYLKIDGKSFADDTVTITGTLKNKEIDVYSNMDYVDLSDGTVAIPREFNKSISVNVGNGVTIHTKMFKDKKYFGISSREGDEEATQVFRAHKEVSNVVTMKVFGLNNDNDYVTFGNDYSDYYVYDANMNYLGRGTDKVKFSTKYYFADNEIEFEEEDEEEETEDNEPVDGDEGEENVAPAGTGGDATQSPNVNNNPGTGR